MHNFLGQGIFLGRFFGGGGGVLGAGFFFGVKLGYPPNFNLLGKPLLVEKYVEGKKEEEISRSPEGVLTYP